MVRALLATVLAIAIGLKGIAALQAQDSATGEYELKAAFLFNFVKFIDWPPSSFANAQAPFTICVLGKDPFGHLLDDALAHKKIGDRMVELDRLKGWSEARHCKTVFVSASESAHLSEMLASLERANVLLVGETPGFAAGGGTIEFTLEDNHVRFTINADAADRSGLKINSQLMALAKVVHDRGGSAQTSP